MLASVRVFGRTRESGKFRLSDRFALRQFNEFVTEVLSYEISTETRIGVSGDRVQPNARAKPKRENAKMLHTTAPEMRSPMEPIDVAGAIGFDPC
jgi:hypothetical protein